MTTKRRGLIAGLVIVGALALGTAGWVAAQDPTATPAPSPTWMGRDGMGSPMGPGMMGGQMGPGMMGGQGGAGMMTADHLEQMTALHDRMAESGACDPALMQELHAQHHPTR